MSLQVELKIQRGIREVEDKLVMQMEKAFQSDYGNLEESQFRNLLQVALSTESPEVIKNFLRYQVGREGDKPNNKKWGKGSNSLAEAIVRDIQEFLRTEAKAIAQTASAPDQTNSIHIQLIRRYLGYGARHLKYLREGKS